MDRLSEMKVWQPDESETLEGMFHLEGGLNWTVRTEDGTSWLLEAEAGRLLEALGPDEGQRVQVTFVIDDDGESSHHVSLY